MMYMVELEDWFKDIIERRISAMHKYVRETSTRRILLNYCHEQLSIFHEQSSMYFYVRVLYLLLLRAIAVSTSLGNIHFLLKILYL